MRYVYYPRTSETLTKEEHDRRSAGQSGAQPKAEPDPDGKASALACHLHDAAKLVDRLEIANARLAAVLIKAGGEWPEKDGVGDDPETPGQLGRLHAIIDVLDELIGRTEGLAHRAETLIG